MGNIWWWNCPYYFRDYSWKLWHF